MLRQRMFDLEDLVAELRLRISDLEQRLNKLDCLHNTLAFNDNDEIQCYYCGKVFTKAEMKAKLAQILA